MSVDIYGWNLIHKGSFPSATLLNSNGMSPVHNSKVNIKIIYGGKIIAEVAV